MKWLLRVASGVVVLVVVFLAVILLPAHIQVRSVTPDLPSQDKLLALRNDNGPVKVSYVLTSSQQVERGQISHTSIIVEWENGKSFLIDTGMSKQEAENFAALLKKIDSSAGTATVYGTISELLGAKIYEIDGVGFTHLHIDHTQGIENFCSVRGDGAVLLQTASQKELHNFNTTKGAGLVSASCLKSGTFSSEASSGWYQSTDFPGLAAFELGGHTPGSTLWAVAVGQKVLLFSGDITNDKASLDFDRPKSALYSYMLVPENTKRTAQLRKWLRGLDQSDLFSVIVSHDLESTSSNLNELISK